MHLSWWRWASRWGSARGRTWAGSGASIVTVALATAAMVGIRGRLSVATTALVLVVPVVLGAAVGGFGAGLVAVAAGFLAYDYFFIPPYQTLTVGAAQNWIALGVYALAMLAVSRVVSAQRSARSEADRREQQARRLFDVSELLIGDHRLDELLPRVTSVLRQLLGLRTVAVLLPEDGRLTVAGIDGEPLAEDAVTRLLPAAGGSPRPVPLNASEQFRVVPLVTADRPVGVMVLVGSPTSGPDTRLLATLANHVAIAIESFRLRDDALRARELEQTDRLRRALVGSVSHDLRTPLGSIKVAVSSLIDPDIALDASDARTLLATIDASVDRLERLVTNLLGMARVEAGTLQPRVIAVAPGDLVRAAVDELGSYLRPARLEIDLAGDLPLVDADPVLIGQVLVNLLENAARHAGPEVMVRIRARPDAGLLRLEVDDDGPGIPAEVRAELFHPYARAGRPAEARGAGLGLAICRAFVEAHGGRLEVGGAPGGGARITFTLPLHERVATHDRTE